MRAAFMMLVCAVASLWVPVAPAASWPELPPPPRSDVQWVAEDMEFNGVPMQIRTFRSQASMAEVLAFYRARWSKANRCECVEDRVGPYQQIARGEGRYFYTVQVRPLDARSSQGYIAVSVPTREGIKPGTGFPQLPATQVVNDIRTDDKETTGRTLLMRNAHSLPANISFYERELALEGWQAVDRMPKQGLARSLRFRRAAEEATLVFNQYGKDTVIGATVVQHRFAGESHARPPRTGVR
jgi:hypothetical protein